MLSPGDYTFSVELDTHVGGSDGSPFTNFGSSSANFNFALNPVATPPVVNISGNLSYCSNPAAVPVPNVTLSLTGDVSNSTLSDANGNYSFSSLIPGDTYTVTPSKTALSSGMAGINTVDVIAVQRHFLGLVLLSGCRLNAADVNGDVTVNTVDVIAVQRFFLGFTGGIANVGKYQFSPASRNYPGLSGDQINQDYNTLILGDVVAPFVAP
jgi:hypothetical protein